MPAAVRILLPILSLFFASAGFAAPLPPFAPVEVTGTIAEARWVPERHVAGLPGMSGSAGHDRVVPAHFIVRMVRFHGVDSTTARTMTGLIDRRALQDSHGQGMPPFILLQIDHPDQHFLQAGMTIRVTGYAIRGDEGGTWTSHERLAILATPRQ